MELTEEQAAELRAVATSRDVSGAVATRARIVLWTAEGRMRKDVGALAGVSLPTVDRWLDRYARARAGRVGGAQARWRPRSRCRRTFRRGSWR